MTLVHNSIFLQILNGLIELQKVSILFLQQIYSKHIKTFPRILIVYINKSPNSEMEKKLKLSFKFHFEKPSQRSEDHKTDCPSNQPSNGQLREWPCTGHQLLLSGYEFQNPCLISAAALCLFTFKFPQSFMAVGDQRRDDELLSITGTQSHRPGL